MFTSQMASRVFFIVLLWLSATLLVGFTPPQSTNHQHNLWYVSISGNDLANCQTPQTPCATINTVLQQPAFQEGDTILATAGHYVPPDNREVVVTIDRDVTISGSWDTNFSQQVLQSTYINGLGRTGIHITEGVSVTLLSISVSGGNFDPLFDFDLVDFWNPNPDIRNSLRQKIHQQAIAQAIPAFSSQTLKPEEKGAIYNEGQLTLYDVKASGLYGHGIINLGSSIIAEKSEFHAEMGRAIYNDFDSSLIVREVELSQNTGFSCVALINNGSAEMTEITVGVNISEESYGAFCNAGTMTINNSRFVSNYASGTYEDIGGAIHNTYTGIVTVTNTLFLHNQARYQAGAIYNLGELRLFNVTIMNNYAGDNTGGIYAGGTVTASNTVIANNKGYYHTSDCSGTIHSQGYNLIQDTTNCDWEPSEGDVLNVPVLLSVIPPYWYSTKYSPLRDAGNPNGCLDHNGNLITTDVYGRLRIGRCDIGALEYDPNEDPFHYQLLPFLQSTAVP